VYYSAHPIERHSLVELVCTLMSLILPDTLTMHSKEQPGKNIGKL
jgi:hypothetical protein